MNDKKNPPVYDHSNAESDLSEESDEDSSGDFYAPPVKSKKKDFSKKKNSPQSFTREKEKQTAHAAEIPRNSDNSHSSGSKQQDHLELIRKTVKDHKDRIKNRPNLAAWLESLGDRKKKHPPRRLDEVDTVPLPKRSIDLLPARCHVCNLEKNVDDKFCWNEQCSSSPVSVKLFDDHAKKDCKEPKPNPESKEDLQADANLIHKLRNPVVKPNRILKFQEEAPVQWITGHHVKDQTRKVDESDMERFSWDPTIYRWQCWARSLSVADAAEGCVSWPDHLKKERKEQQGLFAKQGDCHRSSSATPHGAGGRGGFPPPLGVGEEPRVAQTQVSEVAAVLNRKSQTSLGGVLHEEHRDPQPPPPSSVGAGGGAQGAPAQTVDAERVVPSSTGGVPPTTVSAVMAALARKSSKGSDANPERVPNKEGESGEPLTLGASGGLIGGPLLTPTPAAGTGTPPPSSSHQKQPAGAAAIPPTTVSAVAAALAQKRSKATSDESLAKDRAPRPPPYAEREHLPSQQPPVTPGSDPDLLSSARPAILNRKRKSSAGSPKINLSVLVPDANGRGAVGTAHDDLIRATIAQHVQRAQGHPPPTSTPAPPQFSQMVGRYPHPQMKEPPPTSDPQQRKGFMEAMRTIRHEDPRLGSVGSMKDAAVLMELMKKKHGDDIGVSPPFTSRHEPERSHPRPESLRPGQNDPNHGGAAPPYQPPSSPPPTHASSHRVLHQEKRHKSDDQSNCTRLPSPGTSVPEGQSAYQEVTFEDGSRSKILLLDALQMRDEKRRIMDESGSLVVPGSGGGGASVIINPSQPPSLPSQQQQSVSVSSVQSHPSGASQPPSGLSSLSSALPSYLPHLSSSGSKTPTGLPPGLLDSLSLLKRLAPHADARELTAAQRLVEAGHPVEMAFAILHNASVAAGEAKAQSGGGHGAATAGLAPAGGPSLGAATTLGGSGGGFPPPPDHRGSASYLPPPSSSGQASRDSGPSPGYAAFEGVSLPAHLVPPELHAELAAAAAAGKVVGGASPFAAHLQHSQQFPSSGGAARKGSHDHGAGSSAQSFQQLQRKRSWEIAQVSARARDMSPTQKERVGSPNLSPCTTASGSVGEGRSLSHGREGLPPRHDQPVSAGYPDRRSPLVSAIPQAVSTTLETRPGGTAGPEYASQHHPVIGASLRGQHPALASHPGIPRSSSEGSPHTIQPTTQRLPAQVSLAPQHLSMYAHHPGIHPHQFSMYAHHPGMHPGMQSSHIPTMVVGIPPGHPHHPSAGHAVVQSALMRGHPHPSHLIGIPPPGHTSASHHPSIQHPHQTG